MITAFIGDNGPAREQAAKDYIGSFIGVHGSSAIDRFSGDAIEKADLKDTIASIPFLSNKRMVIVRDLSANKNLSENFEEVAGSVADSTELIIIENHIDSRSKYLGELKKQAEVKEFAHLEGEDLVRWIIEQAAALNGKISHADALFLVERIGTNHQLIINELAKLILYEPTITQESIKLMTTYTPQSSVFAMLDSAFNNQTEKALKLYQEQRALGSEPQAILGMIAWQLHVLAVVKAAVDKSPQQIANESKLNPFVIRKNLNIAKNINSGKLVKMIDNAINADIMIKSTTTNPDNVLQTLIISFR